MQSVTINYSVSRTVALSEGHSKYGEGKYLPSDLELQSLSIEDRLYLDKHPAGYFILPTAKLPIWENLAKEITSARIKNEERIAAKATEWEAAIVMALGKPDDDWLYNVGYGWSSHIPGISREHEFLAEKDSRIDARIKELLPEMDRRNAEVQEKQATAKAKREAEDKADEDAKAAVIESITQWAIDCGDEGLSCSAKEGYSITNAVLKHIASKLQEVVGGEVSVSGTSHWGRWSFKERAAPSIRAFEKYDAVKVAVEGLDKPECVVVSLERIARVTMEASEECCDDPAEYYTAVIVMIEPPKFVKGLTRALIIRVDD